MRYANVAFPLSVDQVFTYGVPSKLDTVLQPGSRVLAPFRGPRQEGVVVERLNDTDLAPNLIKNISECLDEETPTFSAELLALTKWMAEYYVCPWGIALFCAVPAAVRTQKREQVRLLPEVGAGSPSLYGKVQKELVELLEAEGELSINQIARRMGLSYQGVRSRITKLSEKGVVETNVTHKPKATTLETNVAALALSAAEIEAEISQLKSDVEGSENPLGQRTGNRRHAAAAKHAEILQILLNEGVPLGTTDLAKRVGTSISLLRTLERRGFIHITRMQAVRNPLSTEPVAATQPLHLNPAQSMAFAEIQNAIAPSSGGTVEQAPTFLLHGVTGSGKTEVYMQAMAEILAQGKSVIVLVPEISLTPQTASRFVGRFGDRVALLHSRLSAGERYDQWHRIQKGEADIVIGPRSAIFAPVKELGMLIIDEEHSDSYKSDTAPRYHAREVAQKRSELANCPVLLGSATPSLESFYRAKNGSYRLLEMPDRVLDRKMPDVHIVDMRAEFKKGNRTIFSEMLRSSIEERLVRREQIILFLNRRGHSTYVFCRTCGYVEQCDNCSISLTYHRETKRLVCHHCGNKRPTHPSCPQCGSEAIRFFGAGTEAVEQEVHKAFPKANAKRFDADSTSRKNAHQQILEAFEHQQIDILIGTQMVSKGLDFPNVTLVGVIAADTALNLPDFRASEQTFSLLTQVAGRSGRAELEGKVVIQTYMPEHYCILAAQKHDYLDFYTQEVEARGALRYPPFSHVATLLLRGRDEKEVIKTAHVVRDQLEHWKPTDQGGTSEVSESEVATVEILGPAPAPLSKIERKFRWHLLLRSNTVGKIGQLLKRLADEPPAAIKSNAVEFVIDIDPTNTL